MNYRDTRIYRRSLDLVDFVANIIRELPAGYGFLVDQARRASASVTLNYAEGCGRSGAAERRRFFAIAIGSAFEVSAVLDVMHRFDALDSEQTAAGQEICDHVAAMLRYFR